MIERILAILIACWQMDKRRKAQPFMGKNLDWGRLSYYVVESYVPMSHCSGRIF
jgi:hypothetical protein